MTACRRGWHKRWGGRRTKRGNSVQMLRMMPEIFICTELVHIVVFERFSDSKKRTEVWMYDISNRQSAHMGDMLFVVCVSPYPRTKDCRVCMSTFVASDMLIVAAKVSSSTLHPNMGLIEHSCPRRPTWHRARVYHRWSSWSSQCQTKAGQTPSTPTACWSGPVQFGGSSAV